MAKEKPDTGPSSEPDEHICEEHLTEVLKRLDAIEKEQLRVKKWRHDMNGVIHNISLATTLTSKTVDEMKKELEVQDQVLKETKDTGQSTNQLVKQTHTQNQVVVDAIVGKIDSKEPGMGEQLRNLVRKDKNRSRLTWILITAIAGNITAAIVWLMNYLRAH